MSNERTEKTKDVECPVLRVPSGKGERIYGHQLHDWRVVVIQDEAYWYCARCRKMELVG